MEATDKFGGWVNIAAGFLGLTANITQLILMRREADQNDSVFARSLLSLGVADLLTSLMILLRGILVILIFYLNEYQILLYDSQGEMYAAYIFTLSLTFTHVIYVATQRVIAVAFPFKVKQILTKTRSRIILTSLWVLSLAFASTTFIEGSSDIAVLIFHYLVLMTGLILVAMYSVICYKTIHRHPVNNESEEMRRRRQQSDKEVLLYSIAVTVVFMWCNFPLAIIRTRKDYTRRVENAFQLLFVLNPFFDTMVYFTYSYFKRRRRATVPQVPRVAVVQTKSTEESPEQWTTRL